MANTSERPMLDDPALHSTAAGAVDLLYADLQTGLNDADADRYDARFAADLLWYSPFGATLGSSADLLPIHSSLMAGVAPPSRFEMVRQSAPAQGVAIAQVRRQGAEDDADRFSENGSVRAC
jgi:hypothetical protein